MPAARGRTKNPPRRTILRQDGRIAAASAPRRGYFRSMPAAKVILSTSERLRTPSFSIRLAR